MALCATTSGAILDSGVGSKLELCARKFNLAANEQLFGEPRLTARLLSSELNQIIRQSESRNNNHTKLVLASNDASQAASCIALIGKMRGSRLPKSNNKQRRTANMQELRLTNDQSCAEKSISAFLRLFAANCAVALCAPKSKRRRDFAICCKRKLKNKNKASNFLLFVAACLALCRRSKQTWLVSLLVGKRASQARVASSSRKD